MANVTWTWAAGTAAKATKLFSAGNNSLKGLSKVEAYRAARAYRRFLGASELQCRDKWDAFAVDLVSAMNARSAAPAPRTYRASWTRNYVALLGDGGPSQKCNQLYAFDVLEAAIGQAKVICLNGEVFQFSEECLHMGRNLASSWTMLAKVLHELSESRLPPPAIWDHVLFLFDSHWASFEERYVHELIDIEQSARKPLVEAAQCSRHLAELEAHAKGKHMILERIGQDAREQLVQKIVVLNNLANVDGNGHRDLRGSVLDMASFVLHEDAADHHEVSRAVANSVVESFDGVRNYLASAEEDLHNTDPLLSGNKKLVHCLVAWESSWEVGNKYLMEVTVRKSLDEQMATLRQLMASCPDLAQLCDSCDVGLFLVLPRVVWIIYLLEPAMHEEFLRRLLPGSAYATSLFERFDQLRHIVVREGLARPAAGPALWRLLMPMLLSGPSSSASTQGAGVSVVVAETFGDFLHELEPWSIELQRASPREWNQYIAIMVRCLKPGGFDG